LGLGFLKYCQFWKRGGRGLSAEGSPGTCNGYVRSRKGGTQTEKKREPITKPGIGSKGDSIYFPDVKWGWGREGANGRGKASADAHLSPMNFLSQIDSD